MSATRYDPPNHFITSSHTLTLSYTPCNTPYHQHPPHTHFTPSLHPFDPPLPQIFYRHPRSVPPDA